MSKYYTQEEIVSGKFLVASYSHRDEALVTETIDALLDSGVRIWFDTKLECGDSWIAELEALLTNPNCAGAVFFNSINSFKSESCGKERAVALEQKKLVPDYAILPVNIGKNSTLRLLKATFESVSDDDIELERTFPEDSIRVITELFHKNIIYCSTESGDVSDYIDSLISAAKRMPDLIDKGRVLVSDLEEKNEHAAKSIVFGQYRTRLQAPDVISAGTGDGLVTAGGQTYFVEDGVAYTARNLEWTFLKSDDAVCTLLCKNTVTYRNGGTRLDAWLNGTFLSNAFDAEQRGMIIGEVSLLSLDDFENVLSPDFVAGRFDDQSQPENWWLNDRRSILQKTVRDDGTVYKNGYNANAVKAGVRPVIHLDVEKLRKYVK